MQHRPRIDSIDLLRGLVMVVMALDHARDFFGASSMDPRDVSQPALFLTRWVTHFCAPVFVFLAGTAAFLYGNRGKTRADVSRFLATRGLWLVVLEFTIVRFGWIFSLDYVFIPAQVIWAIGVSMLALSLLVFLPRPVIAAFGIALIVGHNALDGIRAEDWGRFGWAWMLIHQFGPIPLSETATLFVAYPLVPWIGVIAAGYAFGPVMLLDTPQRDRACLAFGLGATAAFVLLRALAVYGDPQPWAPQATAIETGLAFLNCEKYPPSLLFLLMTLGPTIALLPVFERLRGPLATILVTIGRVPLLYYVVHVPLIHAVAVGLALAIHGDAAWLFGEFPPFAKPEDYGFALPVVYALWLAVVASLIPLCRWFAEVKQRRSDWWLSYL